MTANHRSRNDDERGIALILTLLLSAAISLIAASLVTIGMSETTSSQNYRMMSQARYGAESGLQAAVDYLTNTYTRPGTSGSDQLTSYTLTTSPVTYNSNPVVLSSTTGSNYPDSTKVTAFQAATHGTLTAGTATIGYDVTATLTSMRTYSSYGGGTSVVQSWTITGIGTVNGAGANTATVQVTSVLEQEVTLATSYGAFAVAATCGALHFHQNSETYSYDSTSYTLSGGQPAASGTSGGDVGTNGNLQADNNVTINGTLSSPRTGVGTCVAGNPDAATLSNHATVTGGIIKLGQAKTFDTPVVPGNPPANVTNTISTSTTCANLGLTSPQCTGTANNLTLTPGDGNTLVFGNLVLSNNVHISLAGPGSISMNTLVVNNNGVLNVTTPANQTLTINVAGNPIPPSTTAPATPIDIQNNTTFTNSSWDPSRVQFIYPGTGTVNINNNGVFCGTVFAPNASMTLANNGAFYGAAIGKTVDIANNGDLYFDRHLSTLYGSASNFMLSAFNWKKY